MVVLSHPQVEATFTKAGTTILGRTNLDRLIAAQLQAWKLEEMPDDGRAAFQAQSERLGDILDALLRNTRLRAVRLPFPYRTLIRYTWGDVSTVQLIQSVDPTGYFSHFTAMHLHGLTEQIPKSIYFNVEQPATGGGGSLNQVGIDRAFKGKCRVTSNIIRLNQSTVYKLNGQNTGQLGVETIEVQDGSELRLTDVERTLIDATVRPIYSGGIAEVADAFKAAKEKLSVEKLVTYLRHLNYTYPYHQAIGYYLERAGVYSETETQKLQQFPMEYDFYLNYQIKNPAFNQRWRLFIPKGF